MADGEAEFTIDLEAQVLNNANSICWYTGSTPLYVISVNGDNIFSFNGGASQDCAVVKDVDCVTGLIDLETNWAISVEGSGFTGSLVFANSCAIDDNIFMSPRIYYNKP